MWGNTLGWIISIILLAGMILGLRAIDSLRQISLPTDFGKDPKTLAKIQLPVSPSQVVAMNDPADPGPIYRQAIDDYLANRDKYEDISFKPTKAEDVKGVELILSATEKSAMKLFIERPEEIVNVEPEKPALKALERLGTFTLQIGLRQKDPKEAIRYAEAAFALGAKLFNERLTVAEMRLGLDLMTQGARMIASQAEKSGDKPRADAAQQFSSAQGSYYQSNLQPVMNVLMSIDPKIVGEHPGDLFFIARNADERVWRVAAIFALGRLRFFAGEGGMLGDQRGAGKVLAELSNDKDPVIATAAKSAASMTREQYQMQR
ncbi:MAG TPA: hypothetical protein VL282_13015 [Tepidisphaeraceae bacterium]|jgi:hypothetical protein|nr:hypothetical protein [Tepidisphaeraceae bacterium]